MNKYVSRGLWFTLFLGGLSLAGIGVANAAETSGSDGTASGNQAAVDLTVPVTLGGNAISVLGDSQSPDATASSGGAAPAAAAPASGASTSGVGGLVSGDQAVADVSVPIAVSGNAVSAVGDSSSAGAEPSAAAAEPASAPAAAPTTSGSNGIASGIQAPVGAAVPVTAAGNAISVLGDSSSSGSSTGVPAGSGDTGLGGTTTGSGGDLSGDQLPIDLAAPVTVEGNAVSVVGDAGPKGAVVTPTTPTTPGFPTGPTGATGATGPTVLDPQSGTGAAPETSGDATAAVVGVAVSLAGGGTADPGAADLGAAALASTGSDSGDLAGFGAVAALLALAGVVLTFGSRNREARAVRTARHQNRTH